MTGGKVAKVVTGGKQSGVGKSEVLPAMDSTPVPPAEPSQHDLRTLPDAAPFAPEGVYPPHKPGEYEFTVPPQFAPFYPKGPASTTQDEPCVPVRDLPIMGGLSPSRYLDGYCVPMRMLHFYHPDTWRAFDAPRAPAGTSAWLAALSPWGTGVHPPGAYSEKSGVTTGHALPPKGPPSPAASLEQAFVRGFFQAAPPPQFQLPLPSSSSPRYPAFSSPDGRGMPPPAVPPPPPVTYPLGHLPRRVPPLPPPEMVGA